MRVFILFTCLNFSLIHCSSGQAEERIVIVMVENNRTALVRTLKFLDSNGPNLISVNLNLECNKDDIDQYLAETLANINSLVLPSVVRPFGTGEYMDIIPCALIYPKGVKTGFINLLSNESDKNLVDKVQLKNSFGNRVRYHLALNIAMSLNTDKTREFMDSHADTIAIDFSRERKFTTYHIDDFNQKRIAADVLHGKIVILSVFPFDHFLVRKHDTNHELINMSTSEIYANIACQIVGE